MAGAKGMNATTIISSAIREVDRSDPSDDYIDKMASAIHQALTAAGYSLGSGDAHRKQHLGFWSNAQAQERTDGYLDLTFEGPEGEIILSVDNSVVASMILPLTDVLTDVLRRKGVKIG